MAAASSIGQESPKSTKPLRSDPVRRHTDGTPGNSGGMGLRNADVRKHYCWVNKTDQMMGPDYYLDGGYDFEHYEEGGVSAVGGQSTRKQGDVIERRGAVLMSCSAERWSEICRVGMDGDGGQELADRMTKQITAQSAAQETIRGLGQRYAQATNRTKDLEPDLEG